MTAFREATSEGWESVGDYSGKNKSRDAFIGQMGFFSQLIPDLDWSVQAMHQDGDVVTVRSRATGTPNGPFFGVNGEGRSFDILTIDIHELENGVIVRTPSRRRLGRCASATARPVAIPQSRSLAMHRRQLLAASAAAAATGIAMATPATAQAADEGTQASLDTVMAFMGAMGGGDMDRMGALMADDIVWPKRRRP